MLSLADSAPMLAIFDHEVSDALTVPVSLVLEFVLTATCYDFCCVHFQSPIAAPGFAPERDSDYLRSLVVARSRLAAGFTASPLDEIHCSTFKIRNQEPGSNKPVRKLKSPGAGSP